MLQRSPGEPRPRIWRSHRGGPAEPEGPLVVQCQESPKARGDMGAREETRGEGRPRRVAGVGCRDRKAALGREGGE